MKNSLNILHKVDWNILNEYISNKLIIANKHPEYNLWILNYTPEVQSDKLWDDYTIACRGMIIDGDGNIIARPLKKFKNYEEHTSDEIPTDQSFEVFEKMDGSLIIVFYYSIANEWIIASRGSFNSDQANEAKKMFNNANFKILNRNYTYVLEALYEENRIVVDYGDRRDLVLLTAIETNTGNELSYDDLCIKYSEYFTIVDKIKVDGFNDLLKLMKLDEKNKEGFVVRFKNGFRIKLKYAEYKRLHAILTNVSTLTVWEFLMNGYDFDELMERVPDEFYNWLIKTKSKLESEYDKIEKLANKDFFKIYCILGLTNRKDFALKAKEFKYTSILFRIYDMKPYDQIIWKLIRPIYRKPFEDNGKI